MALSQSHVDALERALASGALTVESPDAGKVTYRSVAELKVAIAYAREQLAAAASTNVPQSFASFQKD